MTTASLLVLLTLSIFAFVGPVFGAHTVGRIAMQNGIEAESIRKMGPWFVFPFVSLLSITLPLTYIMWHLPL